MVSHICYDSEYKKAEKPRRSGDVIHLESFGQHVVVLNTQEASLDLLEKRSSIYSDRAVPNIMEAYVYILVSLWYFNSLIALL